MQTHTHIHTHTWKHIPHNISSLLRNGFAAEPKPLSDGGKKQRGAKRMSEAKTQILIMKFLIINIYLFLHIECMPSQVGRSGSTSTMMMYCFCVIMCHCPVRRRRHRNIAPFTTLINITISFSVSLSPLIHPFCVIVLFVIIENILKLTLACHWYTEHTHTHTHSIPMRHLNIT